MHLPIPPRTAARTLSDNNREVSRPDLLRFGMMGSFRIYLRTLRRNLWLLGVDARTGELSLASILHCDDDRADGSRCQEKTDDFQRQHITSHQLIADLPDRWLRLNRQCPFRQ